MNLDKESLGMLISAKLELSTFFSNLVEKVLLKLRRIVTLFMLSCDTTKLSNAKQDSYGTPHSYHNLEQLLGALALSF